MEKGSQRDAEAARDEGDYRRKAEVPQGYRDGTFCHGWREARRNKPSAAIFSRNETKSEQAICIEITRAYLNIEQYTTRKWKVNERQ